MKVHYFYFFSVLSVFPYDKRLSLKSTPLSELMAGAALNATFINYTVSLWVNSIMSANGFRTDEVFWYIDADWFCFSCHTNSPAKEKNSQSIVMRFIFFHLSPTIWTSFTAISNKMRILSSQRAVLSSKERRDRGGEMSLINSSEAIFIF